MDRLKIPSTKRVAVIGSRRNYDSKEFAKKCEEIQEFINCRTKSKNSDSKHQWNVDFTPRNAIEPVKNCSKVDADIQRDIIEIVFKHVISKKRFFTDDFPNQTWNAGGIIALSDLIPLIPLDKLKKLKSECGGLQTLLKNNHQIFLVQQGKVQLRKPLMYKERLEIQKREGTKYLFRQKQCWFDQNHPDGCPFQTSDCSFCHKT